MASLTTHDRAVLSCIFNPSLPLDAILETEDVNVHVKDEEEDSEELQKIKNMECEAIRIAESGNLEKALDILNEAISIVPLKASLFNNRAQVFLLRKQTQEAHADLTKAIDLAGDKQLRSKRESLCQRGILYRKLDKEEEARKDFNEAAQLGSNFAKNQLIEMNPYAALCNQMLKQAFENLQKE